MILPKGGAKTEGTILFGKYQICRVIGSGRSGTVFLARHLGLEEFRAIKRVAKEDSGFLRETAVLKNLKHPGIPIVYDLEEDSKYYYLIEEYLEGESLYALVNRQGSLTGAKVISYGIELCQIIGYLHSFKPNPILYLDLQPHNILICKGTLKLIDFDQAILASHAGTLRRRYGTPGCAAPEQYTEESLDERTDIYAIGALVHYMWKGRLPDIPQQPESGTETAKGRTLRFMKTGWEERLEAITARCLCRRREERYGAVNEILEEFVELKQGVFSEKQISFLRIAVVSSSHGMGATHVSFIVSSCLTALGITNLYQECNDSRTVFEAAQYQGQTPDPYGIYHMEERALKPRYGHSVRLDQPEYDAIVEDWGTGLQTVSEKEQDLLILVCGGKWWELAASVRAIRYLAQKENLRIIFNHISSETDVVLPEDITKLIFYKMAWFPVPDSRWCPFFMAVAEGTEGGRKIRKLMKKREAVRRKDKTIMGCIRRFFRPQAEAGGDKSM